MGTRTAGRIAVSPNLGCRVIKETDDVKANSACGCALGFAVDHSVCRGRPAERSGQLESGCDHRPPIWMSTASAIRRAAASRMKRSKPASAASVTAATTVAIRATATRRTTATRTTAISRITRSATARCTTTPLTGVAGKSQAGRTSHFSAAWRFHPYDPKPGDCESGRRAFLMN
jgi:hypothetical protein